MSGGPGTSAAGIAGLNSGDVLWWIAAELVPLAATAWALRTNSENALLIEIFAAFATVGWILAAIHLTHRWRPGEVVGRSLIATTVLTWWTITLVFMSAATVFFLWLAGLFLVPAALLIWSHRQMILGRTILSRVLTTLAVIWMLFPVVVPWSSDRFGFGSIGVGFAVLWLLAVVPEGRTKLVAGAR